MADEPVVTTLGGGLSSDVPDPEAVPGGETYEIKLTSVELRKQKPDKGDGMFIMAGFSILGHPNAKYLTNIMMVPDGKPTEKQTAEESDARRNLAISQFCRAFSIPRDDDGGAELSEGLGNSKFAILTVEANEEYGDQNRISRYVDSN